MWVSHIQMPPTKNHSTFMKMLRQPGCDGFHFTFVHNTLVFADGMTFNLWGSWTSQASPSSPSGTQISIVSPSLLISQKVMFFSSVNSFIRQED